MDISIIFLILIAVLVVWFVFSYNRFIRLANQTKEAWSDIEVQMKRRYDLIPNLVNTVKGYATHESNTLEKVVQARNAAMSANTPAEHANAENVLTNSLRSIFALSESYPDLKANQNFLELQRELSDTENKIQAARRFYNTNVRDLNTAVQVFPSNLVAKMFGFSQMEFFDLDNEEAARQPVNVQF